MPPARFSLVNLGMTFSVSRSEETEQFTQFVRKFFLQNDAKHDCIVETLGGYWPEAEELEEGNDIEPYIVMELMTHNLRQVLNMQLLRSPEAKRRILLDIIAGIAHLHDRRIVHRNIKPENVLTSLGILKFAILVYLEGLSKLI